MIYRFTPALCILIGSIALSMVLLASCGLLNAALGGSGAAPMANTPQARESAGNVDRAIWSYWGELLGLGGAAVAGAAAENKRQKRRAKKAAKAVC